MILIMFLLSGMTPQDTAAGDGLNCDAHGSEEELIKEHQEEAGLSSRLKEELIGMFGVERYELVDESNGKRKVDAVDLE